MMRRYNQRAAGTLFSPVVETVDTFSPAPYFTRRPLGHWATTASELLSAPSPEKSVDPLKAKGVRKGTRLSPMDIVKPWEEQGEWIDFDKGMHIESSESETGKTYLYSFLTNKGRLVRAHKHPMTAEGGRQYTDEGGFEHFTAGDDPSTWNTGKKLHRRNYEDPKEWEETTDDWVHTALSKRLNLSRTIVEGDTTAESKDMKPLVDEESPLLLFDLRCRR